LESLAAALPSQVGTSAVSETSAETSLVYVDGGGETGKGTLLYSLAKNKYAKKPGPESKSDF